MKPDNMPGTCLPLGRRNMPSAQAYYPAVAPSPRGGLVRVVVLLWAVAGLTACQTVPEPTPIVPFHYQPYQEELTAVGGERPAWGLALSGGGLRSALFTAGAVKALYDSGRLARFDMISSVSGGGYTAYWMYAHAYAAREAGRPFGYETLDPSRFSERLCQVITRGDFVRLPQMVGAGLTGRSVHLYYRSIGRTFGGADVHEPRLAFGDLAAPVEQRSLPYWIVNATINRPATSRRSDNLFEFTPFFAGNHQYGRTRWPSPRRSFEVRRAATISGAAMARFLRQQIDNPMPRLASASVTLADGGHSENLGAIALIRRGVRNIVIVDAEHDPEYRFGALWNLSRILEQHGASLQMIDAVPPRGSRLVRAAYRGTVRYVGPHGVSRQSNLVYIKMALPAELDDELEDEMSLGNGERIHRDYMARLRASPRAQGGNWDCRAVATPEPGLADWFTYKVASYSRYMSEQNYTRFFRDFPFRMLRANFPQYTTVDQSFYLDQSISFVGLGYLETQAAGDIIDAMGH